MGLASEEGRLLAGLIAATTRSTAKTKGAKIEVKIPNATTRTAITELEAGKGKRFASMEALMAELRRSN